MPSILPDYEYDIFISYRQNDNLTGGVSEFVEHLKEELAATIKESVSIYFDYNAHDGLLENHSVDKSLEGKLKCLIFIPIISQTYCDTKSYAWQHEFLPFLEMAQKDELGLDIKLGNGNVASRVLPIKIHELEELDKSILEDKLGDVLRGIEFIYKEPGVNRPLKVEDSKSENLNHTDYGNQINKVANAIKEIVAAIKSPGSAKATSEKTKIRVQTNAGNQGSRRKLLYLVGFALVLALAYFWFKFNIQEKPVEIVEVDKSLVVLPFQDMSPNQDQEWFSDGLAEELLNRLSRVSELKLISRTTAFAFKGKGLTAKAIADSLGVSYVLEGSVRKANDQLRITAQLIKAEDDTHIWSNTYDYGIDSIFAVQEDISDNITKALNILLDQESRDKMFVAGTKNVEAYEEYLKARLISEEAHIGDINLLIEADAHYERAIELDLEFSNAYRYHQDLYSHGILEDIFNNFFNEMTDEEVHRIIKNDYNSAIKYSTPGDRLGLTVDKYFVSDDWSKIPSLLKEINEKDLSPGGWGITVLQITNPKLAYEFYLRQMQKDPLYEYNKAVAASTLMNLNELDSAERLLKDSKSLLSTIVNSTIQMRKGDYLKAYQIFNRSKYRNNSYYTLAQLLAGKYEGDLDEMNAFIDSLGQTFGSHLEATPVPFYNALGNYSRADSAARVIDNRYLSAGIMLARISNQDGLTFHLSSTPNLSARLQELGIDPEEFEKERYFQFPVVRFD